jgi:hypothetical protein
MHFDGPNGVFERILTAPSELEQRIRVHRRHFDRGWRFRASWSSVFERNRRLRGSQSSVFERKRRLRAGSSSVFERTGGPERPEQ